MCVCVCLDAVVHVPAVQEPGLHPFVRDLPSGHQAPEPAAGPRDGRSQTLRLWQVRRSDYTRLTFRQPAFNQHSEMFQIWRNRGENGVQVNV